MFDTVAISRTFTRSPDIDLLVKNGSKPFFSKYDGEPYKLVLNGKDEAKEPRLTISKSPKGYWIIKAEVSIGAWMFGSNLFLPNENDMKDFFPMLSDFVRFKTGIKFEAHRERVTRADPTRDFLIGEANVLRVLKELNNIEIPKYDRKPINFTGVYFKNRGRVTNKVYSIYSKFHELANKKASQTEIDLAKGLLRFGIEHKDNRAVSNIAKSLKLPNHNANYILTRNISEKILDDAMKLLNLQPILDNTHSQLGKLAEKFDSAKPLTLAGHLLYKREFGNNYGELPFINLSENTIKKYDRECAKAGVLSLE
ncbi:MAG: hypothetical protein WKF90_00055 [Pyrinomonadaceae bacterium]